ncbi:MAG: hypothetical protein RLZZ126_1047 [Pseudomonadota bacterium]|jgi:hypothetical protein
MNPNLATVTTELIETYGNTARNMIAACRVGNERAVKVATSRWQAAVQKSASQLTEEVRLNALSAQQKLSAYYIQGITVTTDGADTMVGKAVELATKGVQHAAVNAGAFYKATGINALNRLAVAAVPAAVAVSKVAGQIEHTSSLLKSLAAGKKTSFKRAAA